MPKEMPKPWELEKRLTYCRHFIRWDGRLKDSIFPTKGVHGTLTSNLENRMSCDSNGKPEALSGSSGTPPCEWLGDASPDRMVRKWTTGCL